MTTRSALTARTTKNPSVPRATHGIPQCLCFAWWRRQRRRVQCTLCSRWLEACMVDQQARKYTSNHALHRSSEKPAASCSADRRRRDFAITDRTMNMMTTPGPRVRGNDIGGLKSTSLSASKILGLIDSLFRDTLAGVRGLVTRWLLARPISIPAGLATTKGYQPKDLRAHPGVGPPFPVKGSLIHSLVIEVLVQSSCSFAHRQGCCCTLSFERPV